MPLLFYCSERRPVAEPYKRECWTQTSKPVDCSDEACKCFCRWSFLGAHARDGHRGGLPVASGILPATVRYGPVVNGHRPRRRMYSGSSGKDHDIGKCIDRRAAEKGTGCCSGPFISLFLRSRGRLGFIQAGGRRVVDAHERNVNSHGGSAGSLASSCWPSGRPGHPTDASRRDHRIICLLASWIQSSLGPTHNFFC